MTMPHFCSACGEPHGTGTVKDPAIEIAKINAARDVEVAKLNRGEFKATPDELETQVEVAQIEADAQIGAAEAIGDALADAAPAEPAVIQEPTEVTELDGEDDLAEAEPPEVTSSPTPREPKKATHWGAYK